MRGILDKWRCSDCGMVNRGDQVRCVCRAERPFTLTHRQALAVSEELHRLKERRDYFEAKLETCMERGLRAIEDARNAEMELERLEEKQPCGHEARFIVSHEGAKWCGADWCALCAANAKIVRVQISPSEQLHMAEAYERIKSENERLAELWKSALAKIRSECAEYDLDSEQEEEDHAEVVRALLPRIAELNQSEEEFVVDPASAGEDAKLYQKQPCGHEARFIVSSEDDIGGSDRGVTNWCALCELEGLEEIAKMWATEVRAITGALKEASGEEATGENTVS